MARARFIAKASGSNFFVASASVVTSLISRHYRFISSSSPRRSMAGLRLISTAGLLHCDTESWLCHIEAPTVRFGVQALIVLGDNGLGAAATIDEIKHHALPRTTGSARRSEDFRTDDVGRSKNERADVGSRAAVGACARRLLEFDRGFAVGRHAGRRPGAPDRCRRLPSGS